MSLVSETPAETNVDGTSKEPVAKTAEELAAEAAAVAPAAVEPLTLESITMPEGFKADEPTMKSFLDIMNDTEMSGADRANALVKLQADGLKTASEANSTAWADLQKTWQDAVKADPDIGGAKLPATLTSIGKLLDQYGDADTRGAFDSTGAGNNPAIVKFLSKVSALLTESGPVSGNRTGGERTHDDVARSIYTTMSK